MKNITSESYVIVRGRKRWLENSLYSLSDKMHDSSDTITVRESTFIDYKTVVFNKRDITEYGSRD